MQLLRITELSLGTPAACGPTTPRSGDDSTAAVDVAKLSVDACCVPHSSSDPISSVYNG
jgi:hypothetical protein